MEFIKLNIKRYVEARSKGQILKYDDIKSYVSDLNMLLTHDFGQCYVDSVFQLYNLEMIEMLVKEINNLNVTGIIEVCAGDGLLSKSLNMFGVNIKATDDMSWKEAFDPIKYPEEIENLNHVDACSKHRPELVIISWEPRQAHYVKDMLETCKSVKYVIVIGEGKGGCTGDISQWEYLKEELSEVSKYCIARTDIMGRCSHTGVYLMARRA